MSEVPIAKRQHLISQRLDQMRELGEATLFQRFAVGLLPHQGYRDVRQFNVKKDYGADGLGITPDNKRCFVSISFESKLSKITSDITRWKSNESREDAEVVVFMTIESPTNVSISNWRAEVTENHALDLRVVGRDSILSVAARESVWQETKDILGINSPPEKPDTDLVQITINKDFVAYTVQDQEVFRYALANFLGVKIEDVIFERIEEGSVKIVVRLPDEAAKKLLRAFADKNDLLPFWNELLSVEKFEFQSENPRPRVPDDPLPRSELVSSLELEKRFDSQLVLRVQKGTDSKAIEDFTKIYWDVVFQWATSIVPYQDAEDITQEVLMRVLSKIHMYDPQRGRFRSWLRVVTRHFAVNFARSRQRPEILAPKEIEKLVGETKGLDWSEDELASIKAASEQLLDIAQDYFSEEAWHCFAAMALYGQTASSVAEELGISVDVVRVRKHRVLKRLREIIKQDSEH